MYKDDSIRKLADKKFEYENFNFDKLFKTKTLGTKSLEEYRPLFTEMGNRLAHILENSESISTSTLNGIYDFYNKLLIFMYNIQAYREERLINERDIVIERIFELKDENDVLWERVSGVVTLKLNDLALEDQIKDIYLVKDELQIKSDEQVREIENIKNSLQNQFEEFKERYSPLNANVELENQSRLYQKEADKNDKEARQWQVWIIVSGLFLFAVILFFFYKSKDELSSFCPCTFVNFNLVCKTCGQELLWFYLVKMVLLKALFISICIYIFRFCIKNYNASMHNLTVNKQRQNSFGAALHFYNNVTTERKDEILVLAANSIFAHQKTGYIEKGSEPANPIIVEKVMEKVEKAVKP